MELLNMSIKTFNLHETKALTSNQPATMQIPVYGTIHNLILRFTTASSFATEAEIRAQIGNIRLTFNGRDIINTNATRLYELYESLGNYVNDNTGVAGNLELNIGRLVFDNPSIRDNFGYGTADISTIQVTITPGTLTTITGVQGITGRTNVTSKLGAHCKFIDYPQSFNSTGDHTVDTLPRDPDSAYIAVSASPGASGTVTNGEVRVNNITILERMPRDTNSLINSNNRFEQQANVGFLYNFCDGNDGSILPMAGITDLRFITTWSVAPGAASYVMSALTVNGLTAAK